MTLSVIGISAILAGVIQNIAGFGASIVLLLILPRFFDLLAAPALNSAISAGMTIILAIRYRKHTQFKLIWLPCFCFMAAAVSIIWVAKDIEMHVLGAAFGVFLIALSAYALFFQKRIHIRPTPLLAVVFGLLAGVLSGLFAIGATAMALYFLSISKDRNAYMGNLQTLLAINNTTSLITRAVRGIYTVDLILPTLIGFAGIMIGQKLGSKVSGKMDGEKLTRFIYIIVGITGVETLIKQLMLL